MTATDLTQVPIADNHCHGIYRTEGRPLDIPSWRQHFTHVSFWKPRVFKADSYPHLSRYSGDTDPF